MNQLNAIITGSLGFIGSNLYQSIKDKFTLFTIEESIFSHNAWKDEILWFLEMVQPSVIFHVGACANTLEQDVNYMMTRNYESTKVISDYCFLNNVKLIYSSSASCYGTNGLYPSNLYGWSKYIAEQYVIQNNGIALRYFNVYGKGEDHKGNMASVALQIKKKYANNIPVTLFPGKAKRDFVYIKDVISANLYAYKNWEYLYKDYYEVGSGEARPFEDVANILKIPFSYTTPDVIPIGYQFYTCSNKQKWMPGWTPEWTLENGLKDYFLLND